MGIYIDDYRNSKGIVAYHQQNGIKVAQARGTFDVTVHPGHLDFLRRAKELAGLNGILFVNVNNDVWVRRWKGEDRPICTQEERAEQVAEQEMVDYVVVHPSTEIHPSLAQALFARPDILVREDKDPEIIKEELEMIKNWARQGYVPEYHSLPRSHYKYSTSDLIERIRKNVKPSEQ